MINLNDRIIDKNLMNESEFWLLMHIVKRVNRNRKAFPGNELLCKDTGFGLSKLKLVKLKLVQKNLLIVKHRIGKSNKYTSNEYTVNTDLISVYMPMKEIRTNPIEEPKTAEPVTGKQAQPETVGWIPTHGEEKPWVENQPTDERKTVGCFSTHEVLTSISKGLTSVYGNDLENEIETHTQKKPIEGSSELNCPTGYSPPSSARPPTTATTLFRDTKYVQGENGLQEFVSDMVARQSEFELVNLEYYYQRLLNWSDNGNLRKNWLASASMFILNDKKDNKLQLKQDDKNNATTATINGHSANKVADYYARIRNKNRV